MRRTSAYQPNRALPRRRRPADPGPPRDWWHDWFGRYKGFIDTVILGGAALFLSCQANLFVERQTRAMEVQVGPLIVVQRERDTCGNISVLSVFNRGYPIRDLNVTPLEFLEIPSTRVSTSIDRVAVSYLKYAVYSGVTTGLLVRFSGSMQGLAELRKAMDRYTDPRMPRGRQIVTRVYVKVSYVDALGRRHDEVGMLPTYDWDRMEWLDDDHALDIEVEHDLAHQPFGLGGHVLYDEVMQYSEQHGPHDGGLTPHPDAYQHWPDGHRGARYKVRQRAHTDHPLPSSS